MIKFNNVETYGWQPAIRGMRNPMNSWDKSDTDFWCYPEESRPGEYGVHKIGPNDWNLMLKLAKAGPEHAKYRRMITITMDITAPLYWWKEFETYKVGTVANSCSTMHKIHEKEFTLDDFSHEHLFDFCPNRSTDSIEILSNTITWLNEMRSMFVEEKDEKQKKEYWWQMIQLLPSSYNQKRTVLLNYEVAANIYRQRKNHKLDEWREFCRVLEFLPYSTLIMPEVTNVER